MEASVGRRVASLRVIPKTEGEHSETLATRVSGSAETISSCGTATIGPVGALFLRRVTIVVPSKLLPFFVEATQVGARIMRITLNHILSLISLTAVLSTEVCETVVKEVSCPKHNSIVGHCIPRNLHIVLDSFYATYGIETTGCELCAGPIDFDVRKNNSSVAQNFNLFWELRTSGFLKTEARAGAHAERGI